MPPAPDPGSPAPGPPPTEEEIRDAYRAFNDPFFTRRRIAVWTVGAFAFGVNGILLENEGMLPGWIAAGFLVYLGLASAWARHMAEGRSPEELVVRLRKWERWVPRSATAMSCFAALIAAMYAFVLGMRWWLWRLHTEGEPTSPLQSIGFVIHADDTTFLLLGLMLLLLSRFLRRVLHPPARGLLVRVDELAGTQVPARTPHPWARGPGGGSAPTPPHDPPPADPT